MPANIVKYGIICIIQQIRAKLQIERKNKYNEIIINIYLFGIVKHNAGVLQKT